jgi:hypothetical protein
MDVPLVVISCVWNEDGYGGTCADAEGANKVSKKAAVKIRRMAVSVSEEMPER